MQIILGKYGEILRRIYDALFSHNKNKLFIINNFYLIDLIDL